MNASSRILHATFAVVLATLLFVRSVAAQPASPIVYTVDLRSADAHIAEIEAVVPTDGHRTVDLMMAIWSPGFYRVENYATRIQSLSAHTTDGAPLEMTHPAANRWHVEAPGRSAFVVSYRLKCEERSVTTNWVGAEYAVLNGAATFITLADRVRRLHDVRLRLPDGWSRSATALPQAPDQTPHHYLASDFDTLVDSPIVAGNPHVERFQVAGVDHEIVGIGDTGAFDFTRAAADLKKIVDALRQIWGGLPFTRYSFLLVFRRGGGGLEHKNSMLATSQATATDAPATYLRWLNFISHEYCHAFNVKRLRPIELGPFDYEREPHTPSLWISEGLTSYYGELAVARAGLSTQADLLASMSRKIEQLQRSPGRLVQTLAQSSLDVWTSESVSGVNTNANTSVSYYLKGEIAGFVLDAVVRSASRGAKSLDDVMRVAFDRYSGDRGFTPEQFQATASDVAGRDLTGWFRRTVSSTEELDYSPVLEWYGLEFEPKTWTLRVRADATAEQNAHLKALVQPLG